MSDTTDIKSTLNYGTNNKIRPYFYAYERSEEERKSSKNESDLGGEIVETEVTGKWKKLLLLIYSTIVLSKGQIISEIIVWTKIPTKKLPRFLPKPLRRGQIKNFIKPIMLISIIRGYLT